MTKRLARLLRGTFHFLSGEHEKALKDFSVIFNDSGTDSKVKFIKPLKTTIFF